MASGKALGLIAALVGVVLLGGAVAIPLTNDPAFCASCHTIKPAYDTWKASTHKEVTCVACHVRPGIQGFLEDKVLAGLEDVAITFFGTPTEYHNLQSHVASDVCLSCHRAVLRISEVSSRDLPRRVKDVGLIMSHRMHMEAFEARNQGEGCTTCHARVVHGTPIKGYDIVIPRGHAGLDDQRYEPQYPKDSKLWEASMADCVRCHDNRTTHEGRVVSKKCETCHLPDKIGDFLF
ncbi:MAG: NapC/NirT family cytochrome c [Nitrospirales bacterium]|nr:NapC/NirT family cytochrome c [Nitrospira sp.]MDR4502554.1 NapC/NirT family cytochrome c [Nitrospirales bacterium]